MLLLACTFGEAWGPETADCKTQIFLFFIFSIAFFDRRDWMQEARARTF